MSFQLVSRYLFGNGWITTPAGQFFFDVSGNLLASNAPAAGVINGRAYVAGTVGYFQYVNGDWIAGQFGAGGVAWFLAASQAGPYTQIASFVLDLYNPGAVPVPTFSGSAAVVPPETFQAAIGGVIETWHTPALGSGFASNGGAQAPVSYQLEPIGSGGRVRLRGQVNLTANQTAGATMWTMPAAYTPAFTQFFVTPNSLSGYTLGISSVVINANGTVECRPAGTSGNDVILDGICYELD